MNEEESSVAFFLYCKKLSRVVMSKELPVVPVCIYEYIIESCIVRIRQPRS